ncbi:hypothetical protein PG987_002215 [Apiospora arundinis]
MPESARAKLQPVQKMPEYGKDFIIKLACLRCESKGMKCDFTKFRFGKEKEAPMCMRCVRAGAKFCIKQRLPMPPSGRGFQKRMFYIDPRINDDYDQDEVVDMIEDLWSGPDTYSFGGMPLRTKDVNVWALPAWPEADRFAQFEKKTEDKEEAAELLWHFEEDPGQITASQESTAASSISEDDQQKQREERREMLTQRERGVEDWVESRAQSWGKVLPARINKSQTQIAGLETIVGPQQAQHDIRWEALCAQRELQGLDSLSSEKPELDTVESAILRANLRHYEPRGTHLTQRLEATHSATTDE